MINTTTLDGVRDAVLDWCNAITGRSVVLANTGEQAQLNVEFIEVFISEEESLIFEQAIFSDNEGDFQETIAPNTRLRVQLDIYGGNAMQAASSLQRSLWSSRRYLDLWKIMGLSQINTALDLTGLVTGTRRQRAQFSFDVFCRLVDSFESDYFDEVEVSLEVDGEGPFIFDLPFPQGCDQVPEPIIDNFGNYILDNFGNSLYTNN